MKRLLLVFLLIGPRLGRMLWPVAQFEDINYLYGPYLLLLGKTPYQDWAGPNLVGLEYLVAGVYGIFGVDYRTAEALSAIVIALTGLGIWTVARRLSGELAAWVAALVFSTHYLVFRYHILEREIFTTAAAVGILVVLTGPLSFRERVRVRGNQLTQSSWFLVGLLATAGILCKQTMIFHLTAIGLWLVLRRKWRWLASFSFWTSALTALALLVHWLAFGEDFIQQALLFHFLKGATSGREFRIFGIMSETSYLLPLGLGGLLAASWMKDKPSETRRFAGLLLLETGLWGYFFIGMTLAFWPHYMISLLHPLAIGAGLAVSLLAEQNARIRNGQGGGINHLLSTACAGIGVLASLVLLFTPYGLPAQPFPENWGFGGIPRTEFLEVAAFTAAHTPADGTVIALEHVALQARRYNLVNFKDNWGNMLWLRETLNRGGLKAAQEQTRYMTFLDAMALGYEYWLPYADKMVEEGRIAAIVKSRVPMYDYPRDATWLGERGYRAAFTSQHFEVFLRE